MSAHVFLPGRLVLAAGLLQFFSLASSPQAATDFGDAPDPGYPTKLTSNGARHTIVKGFRLGADVDGESDGLPDLFATGDDLDGDDDEDGVTFVTALVPGTVATVDVVASTQGLLDAWVDFNINQNWADPGEKVFPSVVLGAGTNRLTFPVPAGASEGKTFARFRFSNKGELPFDGEADNGEVEDYRVTIIALDFGDCPDEPEIDPVFRIEAPAPAPWDRFGDEIAVSDEWLFVGAYGFGPGYYGTGAAFVYRWNGSAWVYHQTLTASDADEDDIFGNDVAVEGDWAVVCAAQEGSHEQGAVYVFHWDGTTWNEKQKLVTSSRERYAHFGASAAFSGNRLVVGASWDHASGRVHMGSASVFFYDGFDWVEDAKLWPSLGQSDDYFGRDVDFDGDWIVVGAPGDDCAGVTNAGSFYVFHDEVSGWVEFMRGTSVDGLTGDDWFAQDVALCGDHLMVAADNYPSGGFSLAGAVYAYRWNGSAWAYDETIVSPDIQHSSVFGRGIDLHGEKLAVGAPFEGNRPSQNGAVHLFEWGGVNWQHIETLIAPDPAEANQFGRGIGLSDLHVAVGAPESLVGTNTSAGLTFAFQYLPDPYDFPTLYVNDGARHRNIPGIRLGSKDTDVEADGLVSWNAQGDDLDANDDEDGITFLPSILEPGRDAICRVEASVDGYLGGWIDYNDDGDWDDSHEHVFDNVPVTAGFNDLPFTVAPDAAPHDQGAPVFSRFRFSTTTIAGYDGYESDGEVEDYRAFIDEFPDDMDFGDAPDGGATGYPTLLASGGAWHEIVAGAPCLGNPPDAEGDGAPSGDADGDDLTFNDDEDGISFVYALVLGGPLEIKIDFLSSPADGYLNIWIDFTADGDWDDPSEHAAQDYPITAGYSYTMTGTVPSNARPGPAYARARISSAAGVSAGGPAVDGEVEDYYTPVSQLAPATPLRITSIAGTGATAEVEWNAEEGTVYQVQMAGEPPAGEGDWYDLGDTVTGPANTRTDPAATVSSRCYRVVIPWVAEP